MKMVAISSNLSEMNQFYGKYLALHHLIQFNQTSSWSAIEIQNSEHLIASFLTFPKSNEPTNQKTKQCVNAVTICPYSIRTSIAAESYEPLSLLIILQCGSLSCVLTSSSSMASAALLSMAISISAVSCVISVPILTSQPLLVHLVIPYPYTSCHRSCKSSSHE